jgi:hypothetical protein
VGGKAGRGSENKVPFVAAVSLDPEGHLKTRFSRAYHAFNFAQYGTRYLTAINFSQKHNFFIRL